MISRDLAMATWGPVHQPEALDSASASSVTDALKCIMAMWQRTLGPRVGESVGQLLKDIVTVWESQDPAFLRWPIFYEGQKSTVMSVVRQIVLPLLHRWATRLWSQLFEGGGAPEVLSVLLTPAQLKLWRPTV